MITLDRHNLPHDVPTLHEIILQLLDRVDEQRQMYETVIAAQQQQIEQLTQRVAVLEKQLYGKRSERRRNVSVPVDKGEHQEPFVGHGRRVLPDHLPRTREDHELALDDQVCQDCGGFLSKIGDVVSEQLDCKLSQLHVIQHVRHKYACRMCQGRVTTASMPAQPIDKGLPASGLLAEVLVNKYQDALPLYRQSGRFKRADLLINRSTLCEWVMHCAGLLQPLVTWMAAHHLKPSGHIHTDDTPIQMLHNGADESETGRFWIYTSKGKGQDYPACTVYRIAGLVHQRAS